MRSSHLCLLAALRAMAVCTSLVDAFQAPMRSIPARNTLHASAASEGDSIDKNPRPTNYEDEFPLPDFEVPELRQLRWEREALAKGKYASGDALYELRRTISKMRNELIDARQQQQIVSISNPKNMRMKNRISELEKELLELNGRDAEFVAAVSLELLAKAKSAGDEGLAKKYSAQLDEARSQIPQFNLHGLWVGKYGENGYEMINVTYSDDTLIATKVTGDNNVPKGEISFTVDLAHSTAALDPIELNSKAAKQWGKSFLPRFVGKGQVAAEGFVNPTWLEGQLILVGRFFSFAWLPLGHQVFFGRPSSELTLKMLRESKSNELRSDHVAVMRDAMEEAWEESYWIEREADNFFDEDGSFE